MFFWEEIVFIVGSASKGKYLFTGFFFILLFVYYVMPKGLLLYVYQGWVTDDKNHTSVLWLYNNDKAITVIFFQKEHYKLARPVSQHQAIHD